MKSIHSLKLSHRFSILIAVFTAGFLLYGTWSFKTLEELKVNGPVYQRIVQGKDLIADVLPPPEYIIESYLVSLQLERTGDAAEQAALIKRFKELKADYDTRHEFWLKETLTPELADTLLKHAHQPATAFYSIAFDQFIPAIQHADKSAADAAMAKMRNEYEAHRKAIDQVVQITTVRNTNDEAQARDRISSAKILLLAIFLMSLGAGIAVAAVIIRGLLAELGGEPSYAAEIMRKIAAGDLATKVEIKKDDHHSLLHAMKSMQEVLAKIVSNIKLAVDCVSTGAHQIASGNIDLSHRTEEQAASLDASVSSMQKLTDIIKVNADHGMHANRLALSASQVATKGSSVVSQVVETMESINASSKRIADITGVIDGIAFQTNILALNAAVEAARAGEQGRGFAVVATEVRNLAQRSAAAAREIKNLINDSVGKVKTGATLVGQAGTTMDEILTGVKQVGDIIGEITQAGQAQSSGIDQINHAINVMDAATQQNAALVEQAAAAAASLKDQAASLAQMVSIFKLDERPAQIQATQAPSRPSESRNNVVALLR